MIKGGEMTVPEEGLPGFSVRRSSRAKRVRLTVTARDGLVVVVPHSWRGDPADVVASRREWCAAALGKVAELRAVYEEGPAAWLPDRVELPGIGIERNVTYVDRPGTTRVREDRDTLSVCGPDGDGTARTEALRRWLARAVRPALEVRLRDLASEHGLGYARLRVGAPRSRWGSCSSRGTISLSRNLAFLPAQLVDAVILHELVHTVVPDHSPRFWSELARYDPNSLAHRASLRDAARLIPAWADG